MYCNTLHGGARWWLTGSLRAGCRCGGTGRESAALHRAPVGPFHLDIKRPMLQARAAETRSLRITRITTASLSSLRLSFLSQPTPTVVMVEASSHKQAKRMLQRSTKPRQPSKHMRTPRSSLPIMLWCICPQNTSMHKTSRRNRRLACRYAEMDTTQLRPKRNGQSDTPIPQPGNDGPPPQSNDGNSDGEGSTMGTSTGSTT